MRLGWYDSIRYRASYKEPIVRRRHTDMSGSFYEELGPIQSLVALEEVNRSKWEFPEERERLSREILDIIRS
tara:strand:+ start:3185 stop:3400 length:216 start_codon:yes stop_codon:yes gene_type:complete